MPGIGSSATTGDVLTLADLAAETRASLLILTAEHESVVAGFETSYRHVDPA